jgi:hypothetical protein
MNMKPTSDRPRPGAPAAAPAAATAHPKKVYRRPGIVRWGTLLEMTKANGDSGKPDGGRRPYRRTR